MKRRRKRKKKPREPPSSQTSPARPYLVPKTGSFSATLKTWVIRFVPFGSDPFSSSFPPQKTGEISSSHDPLKKVTPLSKLPPFGSQVNLTRAQFDRIEQLIVLGGIKEKEEMDQLFKTSRAFVSSAVDNVGADDTVNELVGKSVSVNGRTFVVERLIASGGFAQVFLVRLQSNQQVYALKKVYTQDHDTMRAIVQEIDLMVGPTLLLLDLSRPHFGAHFSLFLSLEIALAGSQVRQVPRCHHNG